MHCLRQCTALHASTGLVRERPAGLPQAYETLGDAVCCVGGFPVGRGFLASGLSHQHPSTYVQAEGSSACQMANYPRLVNTCSRPDSRSCAAAPSCHNNPIFSDIPLSACSTNLANPPMLVSPCNMYDCLDAARFVAYTAPHANFWGVLQYLQMHALLLIRVANARFCLHHSHSLHHVQLVAAACPEKGPCYTVSLTALWSLSAACQLCHLLQTLGVITECLCQKDHRSYQ